MRQYHASGVEEGVQMSHNEEAVCKVSEEQKGIEDFVRQGAFFRNVLEGDSGEQDVLQNIEEDDCHDCPVELPASSSHEPVQHRVQERSDEQDRP